MEEQNTISKLQFRRTIDEIFIADLVMEEAEEDELIEEYLDNCLLDESVRYFYRSSVPKNYNFVGDMLPNIDENRFRSLVRMSRTAFWKLYTLVKDLGSLQDRRQIPTSVQLLVALSRFGMNGNGASYIQLAKDFGISDGGTINKITKRIIAALLALEGSWIKWPNAARREEISSSMAHEKLPYCIGKGFYSLNLMLVCDPDKNIISYHVGQPGKVHDAKVFSITDLSKNLDRYFSEHEYLIGDSAYKLTQNMITPYKKLQQRDQRHERFNYHSSCRRVAIEHVNGVLKNRFASLKGLRMKVNRRQGHKFACEWVVACLVSHNLLHRFDPWTSDTDYTDEENQQTEEGEQSVQDDECARQKRDTLMVHINSV